MPTSSSAKSVLSRGGSSLPPSRRRIALRRWRRRRKQFGCDAGDHERALELLLAKIEAVDSGQEERMRELAVALFAELGYEPPDSAVQAALGSRPLLARPLPCSRRRRLW